MAPFCVRAVAGTPGLGCAWRRGGTGVHDPGGSVVPYLLLRTPSRSDGIACRRVQLSAARHREQSGIWVLSEKLTSKALVGGVLILAGVYLTERERGEEMPT